MRLPPGALNPASGHGRAMLPRGTRWRAITRRPRGSSRMPKFLTEAQIETYREQGFLSPLRVMSEDEALSLRRQLEAVEGRTGGPLRGDIRHKPHLLLPFLANLVRHPRILDALEDLYGPDLFCWSSNFFIKEAET